MAATAAVEKVVAQIIHTQVFQVQQILVVAAEVPLHQLMVVLVDLVLLLFGILVTNIQLVVPQILLVDTLYIPLQVMAYLILRHTLSIN
jgi:hypothetical protein